MVKENIIPNENFLSHRLVKRNFSLRTRSFFCSRNKNSTFFLLREKILYVKLHTHIFESEGGKNRKGGKRSATQNSFTLRQPNFCQEELLQLDGFLRRFLRLADLNKDFRPEDENK